MTKHQDPAGMTPYAAACPSSDEAGAAAERATNPGTEITALPPAQRALVALKSTATEEALKALILRTSAITAPPVDKAGREEVHRAAMDHKNARLAIEKAAKAATEDAKAFTKAVSAEEKRLIALNAEEEARLFKLRDDYDAAEAARKAEEERKERERVAAIREKIDQIKNLPVVSAADNAETLDATLDDLRAFEITFEDFAEFQDEARAARDASIASLTTMHAAASAREAAEAAAREAEEKLTAQRAELERQQREFEERQAAFEREKAELEAKMSGITDVMRGAAPAVLADPIDTLRAELCTHDYLRSDGVCTECGAVCAFPVDTDANEARIAGAADDARAVSLAALDQPRQRAENAAVAYMLDNTPPSPLTPAERRVIVDPEQIDAVLEHPEDFLPGAITQEPAKEMVTIPREEYDSLLTRSRWLDCLEAAGVDNWEGIDEALRLNREMAPA